MKHSSHLSFLLFILVACGEQEKQSPYKVSGSDWRVVPSDSVITEGYSIGGGATMSKLDTLPEDSVKTISAP